MTEPFGTLERSLRDGPPDEIGFRVSRRDLEIGIGVRVAGGAAPLQRVIPLRGPRRAPSPARQLPIAAMFLVAVAIGGVALVFRSGPQGVTGPLVSATQGPSATPRDSSAPSQSPSSTTSPSRTDQPKPAAISIPPLSRRFVSTRNGFSINYPVGWKATPATQSWPPDTFTQLGSPMLDELQLAGAARFVVASQPLSPGQTEDEWVASYFRPYQGRVTCDKATDLAVSPRLPIDGQSGYLDLGGCPMSADAAISPRDVVFDAFVFEGGRVYQITMDGDVDLAYFEALLATMKLDPASAVDSPNPS